MQSESRAEYKGICLMGEKPHRAIDVRCEDVAGNRFLLPVEEYESRQVRPPWEELPWCDDNPEL